MYGLELFALLLGMVVGMLELTEGEKRNISELLPVSIGSGIVVFIVTAIISLGTWLGFYSIGFVSADATTMMGVITGSFVSAIISIVGVFGGFVFQDVVEQLENMFQEQ